MVGRRGAHGRLKVGLLRPPKVVNPASLGVVPSVAPLGLAYIAAAVRSAGYPVQLVDAAGEDLDAYGEFMTSLGPMGRIGLTPEAAIARLDPATAVVGLSLMFLHEWPQVRDMAAAARSRFPGAVVVLGGETATACSSLLLEDLPEVDYIVRGEGERTMVALLDQLEAGCRPGSGDGLVARTACEHGAGLPVRIRSLIEVDRPAWDLVPLENYFARSPYGTDRGRMMPMLASRGCPYKCSFCSSPQMWTTRYSVRDPDDLADEMAEYVDRYGVENFNFHDLTAITKRQWTLDLCDALDRRGLDVTWQLPIGTRSEALDEVVLRRLAETGCRNVTYAPETGSRRMLAVFDKRLDLDRMLESVAAAERVGLRTHMNFIIGHHAETWKDLWHTFTFAMRAAWAGCDDMSPIRFAPYPGSADWEHLVRAGRARLDDGVVYGGVNRAGKQTPSWNDRMSSTQLRVAQFALFACFYAVRFSKRPARVLQLLSAMGPGKEETHLDELLRTRRELRRQVRA